MQRLLGAVRVGGGAEITWAKLIWTDAWSLAPITLLVAELENVHGAGGRAGGRAKGGKRVGKHSRSFGGVSFAQARYTETSTAPAPLAPTHSAGHRQLH